jgi:hypothetical protein
MAKDTNTTFKPIGGFPPIVPYEGDKINIDDVREKSMSTVVGVSVSDIIKTIGDSALVDGDGEW